MILGALGYQGISDARAQGMNKGRLFFQAVITFNAPGGVIGGFALLPAVLKAVDTALQVAQLHKIFQAAAKTAAAGG